MSSVGDECSRLYSVAPQVAARTNTVALTSRRRKTSSVDIRLGRPAAEAAGRRPFVDELVAGDVPVAQELADVAPATRRPLLPCALGDAVS